MCISYVVGDATEPIADGTKIIAHVCNDVGKWGKGFVLALSRRWKGPEQAFRNHNMKLGDVTFIKVKEDIWVANMCAQKGIHYVGDTPPIRYGALHQCLEIVGQKAQELDASVHMPRIGCGLAGGRWEIVEKIISKTLAGLEVVVYDLE